MKADIIQQIKELMGCIGCVKDVTGGNINLDSEYMEM